MGILIQGGRIVDAATDTDKKGDIYLEDGAVSYTHLTLPTILLV